MHIQRNKRHLPIKLKTIDKVVHKVLMTIFNEPTADLSGVAPSIGPFVGDDVTGDDVIDADVGSAVVGSAVVGSEVVTSTVLGSAVVGSAVVGSAVVE